VAKRHLHVPARRQIRLRGRVHGRLLALRRKPGPVSFTDGRGGDRNLPGGRRRIPSAEGDADGPGPAIHQLAGEEPVRRGAAEGPGGAHRLAAAAPDDAGQDRALLGESVAGVFGARPV
jgi:hypothetical protein